MKVRLSDPSAPVDKIHLIHIIKIWKSQEFFTKKQIEDFLGKRR